MARRPPPDTSHLRGANVLMLLILLLLVGGDLFLAFKESPPDAPQPSSTASPATLPEGKAPAQR